MRLYLAFFLTLTSLNRCYGQSTGQKQGDEQKDQSRAVYEQLSGLGPGQAGFFLSDVGYTAAQFQSSLPAIPSSVATFPAVASSNAQLSSARSPSLQQSNTLSQHRFQTGSRQSDSQNIAYQHNQQTKPNQYNQQPQPNQYNMQPQPNQYNMQPQPNQYNQQPQPNQYNMQPQPNQYNQQPQPNQYNQQPQTNQYNQQPQPNQYTRQQYQQYNQYYQSINKQQLRPPTQAQSQSAGVLNQAQANQYNQYNQQRQQAYQLQYDAALQRQPVSPLLQRQPLSPSQKIHSLPPPQQRQPVSPPQQRPPHLPSQQQESFSPPQHYQPLSPSQQRQHPSTSQQYQTLSNANTINKQNSFNDQSSFNDYSSDRTRLPPQEMHPEKIQRVTQFPPQVTLTRPLHIQEPIGVEEDDKNNNASSKTYLEEKPIQIFNVEDDNSQVKIPGDNSIIQTQSHSANQRGPTNLRFQGTFTLNQPHQVNHDQRGYEKPKINHFEDKREQHQLNEQNQEEKLREFSNFGTRQRKTNRNYKNEGPIDVQQHRNRGNKSQQIVSNVSPSKDEEHKSKIPIRADHRQRVQHIPEDHIQRTHHENNRNPYVFKKEQTLKQTETPTPLFSNLEEIQREELRDKIHATNSFISQDNSQSFVENKNKNKQVPETDNSLNKSPESTTVTNLTGRRRVKVVRQRQRVYHQSKDENIDEGRHQVLNYPKQTISKIISEEEEIKSPEEVAHSQAVNAKYSFQSSFNDTIHDNSQMRQEVRDGLKIKGQYSYSDGFFKRTVHYVADENGYRVIKEISEPIGDGPIHDPDGQVDLNLSRDGRGYTYSVSAKDIPSGRWSQEEPLDIDVRVSN